LTRQEVECSAGAKNEVVNHKLANLLSERNETLFINLRNPKNGEAQSERETFVMADQPTARPPMHLKPGHSAAALKKFAVE
jgi:hypothetical protein